MGRKRAPWMPVVRPKYVERREYLEAALEEMKYAIRLLVMEQDERGAARLTIEQAQAKVERALELNQ